VYVRKRTRRKIYDTTMCPVTHAIVGASITDEESLEILRKKERGSLEAFRTGVATKQDWNNINAVVQLAESMACANIGPEVMVHVKIAEMHLMDAHDRMNRLGKLGSTGPGLQSFQDILEYHELQRTAVSRSVYESHIKRVTDMIRSKSPKIRFL
jgi:predicted HAD superfamily phosphohydrolase